MRVTVDGPFDFDLTAGHLTRYRGRDGADILHEGTYYRALSHPDARPVRRIDGSVLVAAARPAPVPPGERAGDASAGRQRGEERSALDLWIPGDGAPEEEALAARHMGWLLGLDADMSGFHALLDAHPVLGSAVGSLRGLRPARAPSVFEALVQAVVGQQISAAVARTIREALVNTLGAPAEADGLAMHAFPEPAAVLDAGANGLRTLKLSARKAEYLQEMAQRTLDGELAPERFAGLDDEAAVAALSQVRGVGRWTAAWVLLGALGRPDLLPAGDLALQRTVGALYGGGERLSEGALERFAERWRPYRGYATVYLFAHLRQLRAAQQEGAR
jgi:DNA-3-methyladenine glycosylase II